MSIHTFAINHLNGQHLGFLVMDEDNTHKSGVIMIKPQCVDGDDKTPEFEALFALEGLTLTWNLRGEIIEIDADDIYAKLIGEYLFFRKFQYRLTDLTGVW
ncbi:MAG: hypothetical protein IK065_01905 [Neisseriaceae bacterium]|nr:hypothetical protein [Neisseriaceae bacterium]